MTPFSTVFLSVVVQLCPPCVPIYSVVDTLGGSADPASPGPTAEVFRFPDGRTLISSEVMGPEVFLYDSDGNFVRTVARRGDGPGEIQGAVRFAAGHGKVLFLEMRRPLGHLFEEDLRFLRSIRLPGIGFSAASVPDGGWIIGSLDQARGDASTIQLVDSLGNIQTSIAPLTPPIDPGTSIRFVGLDESARIWSVSLTGLVEVYDRSGSLLANLQLEGNGIGGPLPLRLAPDERPPTVVSDLRLDADGLAWVFLIGPEEGPWRAEDAAGPTQKPPEETRDTLLRFLRFDGQELSVLGEATFDTLVRPLQQDMGFDLVELPSGDRKVRLGTLRLSPTADGLRTGGHPFG